MVEPMHNAAQNDALIADCGLQCTGHSAVSQPFALIDWPGANVHMLLLMLMLMLLLFLLLLL